MFKTPAMLIKGVIVIVYNSVRSHFTDLTHKPRSVTPADTHRTAPARYHTHTHSPHYCRVGLWDVVLKRHALKSNILQPVFNLRDDGALMESGAACSCLQSALDDYEAAFVFAVLFFLIISIHVVLYLLS